MICLVLKILDSSRSKRLPSSNFGIFCTSSIRCDDELPSKLFDDAQTKTRMVEEIFAHANRQPNIKQSEFTFLKSVVNLIRAKNFPLIDNILHELASRRAYITPKLISCLVRAYNVEGRPDKVHDVYFKTSELKLKPSPKQMERILEILVCSEGYLKPAYKLFKIARSQGVALGARSYNILMRSFAERNTLSIACKLFSEMSKRDILPTVDSYKILIQGLSRRNQVRKALELLQDMFNKGIVPDSLIYSTLLNSLCRKKKLREAYKLLCRMKYKGCSPDLMHYNTVLIGFVREGRAADGRKILADMESNGCLPNVLSYRTIVAGLCNVGMVDEAVHYMKEMVCRGLSPHFSVQHMVIKRLCDVGRREEACGVVIQLLNHGECLRKDTWTLLVPLICDTDEVDVESAMTIDAADDTRLVQAAGRLEDYLRHRTQHVAPARTFGK